MLLANNYSEASEFFKVMLKMLLVFFRTHCK